MSKYLPRSVPETVFETSQVLLFECTSHPQALVIGESTMLGDSEAFAARVPVAICEAGFPSSITI